MLITSFELHTVRRNRYAFIYLFIYFQFLLALFTKFMIPPLFFAKVSHLVYRRYVDTVLLFIDRCVQKDKQTTNPNKGRTGKENGAQRGTITQDSWDVSLSPGVKPSQIYITREMQL